MTTTARDHMTRELVVLRPEMSLYRAMQTLIAHDVSGAPVVDAHGGLVGILAERDCLTVAFGQSYHQEAATRVADHMSRQVETIAADTPIIEVVALFHRSRYRRFPVVEENQLVGLLSRRDILRAVVELWSARRPSG